MLGTASTSSPTSASSRRGARCRSASQPRRCASCPRPVRDASAPAGALHQHPLAAADAADRRPRCAYRRSREACGARLRRVCGAAVGQDLQLLREVTWSGVGLCWLSASCVLGLGSSSLSASLSHRQQRLFTAPAVSRHLVGRLQVPVPPRRNDLHGTDPANPLRLPPSRPPSRSSSRSSSSPEMTRDDPRSPEIALDRARSPETRPAGDRRAQQDAHCPPQRADVGAPRLRHGRETSAEIVRDRARPYPRSPEGTRHKSATPPPSARDRRPLRPKPSPPPCPQPPLTAPYPAAAGIASLAACLAGGALYRQAPLRKEAEARYEPLPQQEATPVRGGRVANAQCSPIRKEGHV